MMNDRLETPCVLASCDDGWQAEGFGALLDRLTQQGFRVSASATKAGSSSMGTAIGPYVPGSLPTIASREVKIHGQRVEILDSAYPAAAARLLVERHPHAPAFVAGVNEGPNVGPDLLHSGTVCLALIASWLGKSALAVSLDDVHSVDEANPGRLQFDRAAEIAVRTLEILLELPETALVNVNVPNSLGSQVAEFVAADPLAGQITRGAIPADVDVLRSGAVSVSCFGSRSLQLDAGLTFRIVELLNQNA